MLWSRLLLIVDIHTIRLLRVTRDPDDETGKRDLQRIFVAPALHYQSPCIAHVQSGGVLDL